MRTSEKLGNKETQGTSNGLDKLHKTQAYKNVTAGLGPKAEQYSAYLDSRISQGVQGKCVETNLGGKKWITLIHFSQSVQHFRQLRWIMRFNSNLNG